MTRAEAPLRSWVEEVAMLFERDGLPRMAGRIFAWLLVCEPPEQSLGDLAAALQGSRASMSTMSRLLLQAGLIERVRPPGARTDHFRIHPGQWEGVWRSRVAQLSDATAVMQRGLGLVAARPAASRARLEELHGMYVFFAGELPRMLDRWAQRRARAAPAGEAVARSSRKKAVGPA